MKDLVKTTEEIETGGASEALAVSNESAYSGDDTHISESGFIAVLRMLERTRSEFEIKCYFCGGLGVHNSYCEYIPR